MSTTTQVGAVANSVPKLNLDALEREVDVLVSQGVKDLEIELCEQRAVIRRLRNAITKLPKLLKFSVCVAVLRSQQPKCHNVTLSQGCVTDVTSDKMLHDVTEVTSVTSVTEVTPPYACDRVTSDDYYDDECPF